ncbi:MAG TPA: hypothetical protein VFL64_07810 [Rhizobacter sp.]|nr:hypothetical protein [Rhizobacter sp.]
MKSTDQPQPRRTDAAPAEWTGTGWINSSWELQHGLEVTEDLPADDWPPNSFLTTLPLKRNG